MNSATTAPVFCISQITMGYMYKIVTLSGSAPYVSLVRWSILFEQLVVVNTKSTRKNTTMSAQFKKISLLKTFY